MKKFLNNRLSTQPEYEKKCLQLLEHDFMVQQYLQQTTRTHNNQESYLNLLNQISFNNQSKKRRVKLLNHQNHSLASRSQQREPKEGELRDANRCNEMLEVQKKIIEQEQIKNTLLAQLKQVSKSVNLMKGDVSRIIEKNQSTNVLQKKTSKVKIFAQDQLKKVSLALQKDHTQILQRNNMQLRFNKKLKNICNNENNFLKKIQNEYLRHQKRKNIINQKIVKIQEVMKNLSERERTKQQIKIINEKNRINFQQILDLLNLIKKQEQSEAQKEAQSQQYSQSVVDNHLSLKTQRFKSKIKEIETDIVQYIKQLSLSIQQGEKLFEANTQKVKQYKCKLQKIQQQEQDYKSSMLTCRKVISSQQKRIYQQRLHQLKANIHLLLIFWEFIKNNTQITLLIDQNNQRNELTLSKRSQNSQSRFYRRSEEFQKQKLLIHEQNSYSNKFYELLSYLSGTQVQQINIQNQYIIKSLQMSIIMWLKGFKNLIIEEIKVDHSDKLKKARSLQGMAKYQQRFHFPQEQLGQNKYRLSLSEDQEDKLKTMLQLIATKKLITFEDNQANYNITQAHKQRKTEGNEQVKAHRIKILEKVDYDYYKMLKNVLKIQKENTKKNYDFNKTFNRSKFTEKNILQQQKRYQSNFALQFIKKNEKSIIIESQRTIASKASVKEKPFRRRQFHHKTELMMNFKNALCESSRKIEPKIRFKESGYNFNSLQRTSKLLEKKSESVSSIKQNSTSFLSRKKPLINFSDQTVREEY